MQDMPPYMGSLESYASTHTAEPLGERIQDHLRDIERLEGLTPNSLVGVKWRDCQNEWEGQTVTLYPRHPLIAETSIASVETLARLARWADEGKICRTCGTGRDAETALANHCSSTWHMHKDDLEKASWYATGATNAP